MVRENFVFWQRDDKSDQGGQFIGYYSRNCTALPCVCAVDPLRRQGRGSKIWSKMGINVDGPENQ